MFRQPNEVLDQLLMSHKFSSLPPHIRHAMQLFNLKGQFSLEDLTHRYEQTKRTWDPNRYAGHTNNPGHYMQMYKKGEWKTKEIHSAFLLLQAFLENKNPPI